ncbi:hypothetical protein MTR67_049709 [Solanum verrucosum]|uniref:Uncharacterized protein n=1 Tax=Solanum verrucosum TaxID=315347 RepID=A0AAF0V354_SOLVR|nr:hypothetical protein MTR67_049709 [Solanum verrucosum]
MHFHQSSLDLLLLPTPSHCLSKSKVVLGITQLTPTVVTAVTELGSGKPNFYSTPDVIAFCREWRLPTNHVWLLSTRYAFKCVLVSFLLWKILASQLIQPAIGFMTFSLAVKVQQYGTDLWQEYCKEVNRTLKVI